MESLQIEKSKVLELYSTISPEGQSALTELFGKDLFNRKVTDRLKTVEDCCEQLGIQRKTLRGAFDTADEIAYKEAKVIALALNEGWVPDWTNSNEYKYYPWLKFVAGSGFAFYVVGHAHDNSSVGSRLVFKTSDLAKYAATQFSEVYNALFSY